MAAPCAWCVGIKHLRVSVGTRVLTAADYLLNHDVLVGICDVELGSNLVLSRG